MPIVTPYKGQTVIESVRSNWHEFFLADAFFVSGKSKDRSTKCGCVVTTQDHDVLCRGWNDLPRRVGDTLERRQRPEKYLWTEHAERNAFYNAARIGVSLKNGTLYVNRVPCPDCARGVVQAGISQVVTTVGTDEAQFAERLNTVWSMELFRETGIPVTLYGPEVHKRLSRFRFESDR